MHHHIKSFKSISLNSRHSNLHSKESQCHGSLNHIPPTLPEKLDLQCIDIPHIDINPKPSPPRKHKFPKDYLSNVRTLSFFADCVQLQWRKRFFKLRVSLPLGCSLSQPSRFFHTRIPTCIWSHSTRGRMMGQFLRPIGFHQHFSSKTSAVGNLVASERWRAGEEA